MFRGNGYFLGIEWPIEATEKTHTRDLRRGRGEQQAGWRSSADVFVSLAGLLLVVLTLGVKCMSRRHADPYTMPGAVATRT